MTKVAEVIRFYSLDDILQFVNEGGEYPMHHVWCYDQFKAAGIPTDYIKYNRKSVWNKLGMKLNSFNLQQQINCIKQSRNYDVVFAPFAMDAYFLVILKLLGLYKKPILAIAADAIPVDKTNFLKRFKQRMNRYFLLNGIDTILFFTEQTYEKSKEFGSVKSNHRYLDSWGVDLDFFTNYLKNQTKEPEQNYIYTTGGTGRDYRTLINAFDKIDFNLRLTAKGNLNGSIPSPIPPNVFIDSTIIPGLHSVGLIRNEYYNSLAVAIPLCKDIKNSPVGLTVLFEALSMAKPIISTYNNTFPFDIEKEKVGLYVDPEDVQGWIDCVNYLKNNADIAREMGERGQHLCQRKYNYKIFSQEVMKHIDLLCPQKENIKLQKNEITALS